MAHMALYMDPMALYMDPMALGTSGYGPGYVWIRPGYGPGYVWIQPGYGLVAWQGLGTAW